MTRTDKDSQLPLTDERLRQAFDSLSTDAVFGPACPTAPDLWSAARNEPGADVERVVAHLAGCGACAAAWRVAQEFPVSTPERVGRGWLQWATAASLVAVAGMGIWITRLNHAVDQLTMSAHGLRQQLDSVTVLASPAPQVSAPVSAPADQPILNFPIVDLAGDINRSQGGSPTQVVVSEDAPYVGLVLSTARDVAGGLFGLIARDAGGQVIWRGDGLRPALNETFSLALPRRLFSDGQYTLTLERIDGTERRVVQTYELVLRGR